MILSTSSHATADTEAVGLTTLDQLTHAPEGSRKGINRLAAMLGASRFSITPLDNGDTLTEFSFKMCRQFNRCQITYRRGPDDYSFRLARVKRDGTYTPTDFMVTGLHGDMLAATFTERTGLDTHL